MSSGSHGSRSLLFQMIGLVTFARDFASSKCILHAICATPPMTDQERRSSTNSFTPVATGTSPVAWASNPDVAPCLRGGYFPEATNYWGKMKPTIAYAMQHQIPGAARAYQRMTSAANSHQLVSGFNANLWSMRPLLEH